jgi:hypothetical protein
MSKNHRIFLPFVLLILSACSSTIPDAKSEKKSSNVKTTDNNGVVTAEVG